MIIGIASDHRGFELKQVLTNYLNKKGYNIIDYGTTSNESVDYPQYAFKIGNAIKCNEINFGILICGTGIGMSIACNKVKGVRCAKVSSLEEAVLSRQHNNANVIAISSDLKNSCEIIEQFLKTDFSNLEKHRNRVEMIDNYDN